MKDFNNPEGCWEHKGNFIVVAADSTSLKPLSNIKATAIIGRVIEIGIGRIRRAAGGFQLYIGEKLIYFKYPDVKSIQDNKGNYLWVNDNYRKEVLG